jgi:hypothetical protein
MGLKDKLTTNGSNLTSFNGATPGTMVGATPGSELHFEYSINGNPNIQKKPKPSQLDLDGLNPSGPLNAPGYGQINNSFKNGEYLNNLPG